jgi:malate dehydrogenase (oxaloacetate-decarboxylating)
METPMIATPCASAREAEQRTGTSTLTGQELLECPLLNKGSAFTEEERREFGLLGLLPAHVASMEAQLARTYENYARKQTDLERYIYLASLQDRNARLFYRLVADHVAEMSPIVYTPTVGLACQIYSHIFRRPHGLYVSYPYQDGLDAILASAPAQDTRVIVVTDGERILGLGDLGVGGLGIPVGKLALYTVCAGVHPATTLPIVLDVGTDNDGLLADPLYLGWHHQRVRGQAYDDFIEAFVQAVKRAFPNALLQWEDFAKDNARRLLDRYQYQICSFNDDIQGTGAVTLAGLLAATEVTRSRLAEQRIVIVGAGSAATGIAEQLVAAMTLDGLSENQARSTIWLLDRRGLVHTGRADLDAAKRLYAQPWEGAYGAASTSISASEAPSLEEIVARIHPTILIGTAAMPGAFNETIVREMARHVERPIIFPLSNPTAKSEAVPADLIAWTDGRALIATGSPFPPVAYGDHLPPIGQCNNMFIFPGMGLGITASGARFVTLEMFVAAAYALSACSPARSSPSASLYPAVAEVRQVSRRVAIAVAQAAQRAGVADLATVAETERRVDDAVWEPHYTRLTRRAVGE